MVYPIRMRNKDDVIKVNNITSESGMDISVSYGTTVLDPHSIFGLFTLLGKQILLVAADDSNPEEFKQVIKKIGL